MIGFVCSYTPLPLLHAAGFKPTRILPQTEAPDQAGAILHDNLCPHVKRVLDRALAGELPALCGVVFMNSCEAVRRLSDAWRRIRPSDRQVLIDLPTAAGPAAEELFASELRRLGGILSEWGGAPAEPAALGRSIELYNDLAGRLERLAAAVGRAPGRGWLARLQTVRNFSVSGPPETAMTEIDQLERELPAPRAGHDRVPIFVFGNLLSDPEAWDLFDSAGFRLAGDDLCSGARQLTPIPWQAGEDPYLQLARGLLGRRPCARTLVPGRPGALAHGIARQAREAGARGVVAHVMKFCDPYLARLPQVRDELAALGLPLLVLEGDCSLRSLGQQRTRLEAFAEMLRARGAP